MNPIQQVSNLLNDLSSSNNSSNSASTTNPADGDTAPFLQAIDQIVAATEKASKANEQAAVEKSKMSEEKSAQYQQKIAFLSSQISQAQIALSSLEGNQTSSPSGIQKANQLVNFKRQELYYWQTRLAQADLPNEQS